MLLRRQEWCETTKNLGCSFSLWEIYFSEVQFYFGFLTKKRKNKGRSFVRSFVGLRTLEGTNSPSQSCHLPRAIQSPPLPSHSFGSPED